MQKLKVSAFYVEKQKSFIPKKYDLSRRPGQFQEMVFAVLIFSEDFGLKRKKLSELSGCI